MVKKITNTAPKADLYQTITDKVLALLEGGKLPWHQPWAAGVDGGAIARPIRATGEAYNGINILLLWSAAAERGFVNPQWMTFKQAIEFGGAVRKGEKATMCVYANSFAKIEEDEQGQDEERRIPFLKQYHVFNVEQIDGLPDRFYAANVPAAPRNTQDRDDAAEAFFAATGADIRHGGNKAFHQFDGVTSFVQMPAFEAFDEAEAYYATLAHEMIHWTKTPKRLDREFGRKRFGDEGYAMEELVAEMGAAFLLATLGLSPMPRPEHAAYIQSWIRVLKNDKKAIVSAASHSGRAADYLHSLQPVPQAVAEAA